MLGVMLDPRRALSDQVVIGEVLPDSPAQKAGLKAGDRIVTLDGAPLGDWKDLTDRVGQHQPGDKIKLEVYRKDIQRYLVIKGQNVESEADLRRWRKSSSPARSSAARSYNRIPSWSP